VLKSEWLKSESEKFHEKFVVKFVENLIDKTTLGIV